MSTMKERWICPNLDVQVFTPQEFVAACEVVITWDYYGMALESNWHFYIDTDDIESTIDRSIEDNSAQTEGFNGELTIDLTTAHHYYFFKSQSDAHTVFRGSDPWGAYQALRAENKCGYLIGEASNAGGNKVHAGTIKKDSYKNQS